MRRWASLLSSGFGTGWITPGPGTWGALWAWVFAFVVKYYAPNAWHPVLLIITVCMTILGYLAIRSVIPQWGEDPSRVTVDEIVGMWVTILCIPGLDLRWWIGAFALFRFFDILKPLGIRYFDRLRGARGVLLDDIVAGLYAGVTIRILHDVVCS